MFCRVHGVVNSQHPSPEMSCCFGGGQERYQETDANGFPGLGYKTGSIAAHHQEGKDSSGAAEERERPQRNSWLQIDDKGELILQEVAVCPCVLTNV